MVLYFTIIDSVGHETPIDDPIGWDSTVLVLDRDPDKHGVAFKYQASPYTYDGVAFQLLKAEYELNGIEGKMYLRVEIDCGDGIEELETFRFVFLQYDDSQGGGCSVTIPVEDQDDAVVLFNRIDQKVNLATTETFEGSALSAYTALPFVKTLPGKRILVQDYSTQPADLQESFPGDFFTGGSPTPPTGYADRQAAFSVPGFTNREAIELGNYYHPSNTRPVADVAMAGGFSAWEPPPPGYIYLPYWINDGTNSWDHVFPFENIPPIVNYDASLGPVYGDITVTIEGRYRKVFTPVDVFGTPASGIDRLAVYLGILKGFSDPADPLSWTWLSTVGSDFDVYPLGALTNLPLGDDFTFSFPGVVLEPGDRIYYFDKISYRKKTAYSTTDALYITNVEDSYFKVSGLSEVADSTAKLFMINEAFSRVTEAVTDDRLRVYSDFYGRTDSQPYTAVSDGCGSHTSITQGKLIRKLEDVTPAGVFALSFKDLWDGMNPVHNLGAGIEPDPARPGFNRLRIEEWRHFYEYDTILECIGVDEVKRSVSAADHVSIFKFGYAKWEAEAFNGIDEFMTQREYRTELTQASKTFSQISNFIASGYAIEVTRRKGNTDTKDWRYDNDAFLITMRRSSGVLIPQVGDISGDANILDPTTVYNFKIRPSAMAMHWLPYVLASYRQADVASRIIFTDGTGNYNAEGELSAGICIIEGGVISEKQDLSPNDMAAPTDGLPIKFNESIAYEFPITWAQFKALKASPAKWIYYENDRTSGYGWIRSVQFKLTESKATFNLIPSR